MLGLRRAQGDTSRKIGYTAQRLRVAVEETGFPQDTITHCALMVVLVSMVFAPMTGKPLKDRLAKAWVFLFGIIDMTLRSVIFTASRTRLAEAGRSDSSKERMN